MNEYVIIEKSELAAIANKVRGISDSNAQMNVLEIKNNLGAGIDAVKDTLTGYLEDNGKTFDQDLSLGQIANIVGTVEGEDLSAEISAQANLIANQNYKIAELAEILDGKAGGNSGDSPSLCDVSLKAFLAWGDSPSCEIFIYTTFENSKITTKILTYRDIFGEVNDQEGEMREGEITVLQNSFILVYSSNDYAPGFTATNLSNNIAIWESHSNAFGIFLVGEGPTANIEFNG